MSLIFDPAKAIMNRLKTAHKMILISTVFLVPLVVSVGLLVLDKKNEVNKIQNQREGVEYIQAARSLFQNVLVYRGMVNAVLVEDDHDKQAQIAQITKNITHIDDIDKRNKQLLVSNADWDQIKSTLSQLNPELSKKESRGLIEQYLRLNNDFYAFISDKSGLVISSHKEISHVNGLVTKHFPAMIENMALLQSLGINIATSGFITDSQKTQLEELLQVFGLEKNLVLRNLEGITEQKFGSSQELTDNMNRMKQQTENFTVLLEEALIEEDSDSSFNRDNTQALLTLFNNSSDETDVDIDSDLLSEYATDSINSSFTMLDLLMQAMDQKLSLYQKQLLNYQYFMLIGSLFAIGFASYMFCGFYMSVLTAVNAIKLQVSHLASGDLTSRVTLESKDELADIAEAFNVSVESFARILTDFASANQKLLQSSLELNNVAESTGKGAQNQTVQTELLVTSMLQMSSTVQEVASHASHCAQETGNARNQALEGGERINNMIQDIKSLSDEVENVADVVKILDKDVAGISTVLDVIQDISEKTNLLALNAAIEAARAGEQGRGFAVVADEVRELAGRTQDSTRNIKKMIENLQQAAQRASAAMKNNSDRILSTNDHASKAGSVIDEITQAVEKIDNMSTQIASSADEQSQVADEINQNISEIKSVVDTTSTGVQHTVERCLALDGIAKDLQHKISQFKY